MTDFFDDISNDDVLQPKLTEIDLRGLFSATPAPPTYQKIITLEAEKQSKSQTQKIIKIQPKWLRYLKIALIFLAIFAAIFIIANFPAIISKAKFWYKTKYQKKPWTAYGSQIKNSDPNSLFGPASTPEGVSKNASFSPTQELEVEENHLVIPNLSINTPIIWEVEYDQILEQLKHGIVQIKGTSLPGKGSNVFISGHSSNFIWESGNYKHIFSLLEKINEGDIIQLRYQGVKFTYEVQKKLVVNPKDTWVMEPQKEPILSIMTCVPVGTNLRRLIVQARQINPEPAKELPKVSPSELPPILPDILGIF